MKKERGKMKDICIDKSSNMEFRNQPQEHQEEGKERAELPGLALYLPAQAQLILGVTLSSALASE